MTDAPTTEVTTIKTPVHDLKVWPQYFAAILSGLKRYEFRRNDRHFQPGDVVLLREWDPATQEYTGRFTARRIGWTSDPMTSEQWGPGVILSLMDPEPADDAPAATTDIEPDKARGCATAVHDSVQEPPRA